MSLFDRVLRNSQKTAVTKRSVREASGVDGALLDALEWGDTDSSDVLVKRGLDLAEQTKAGETVAPATTAETDGD
jgi:hypothetical protein